MDKLAISIGYIVPLVLVAWIWLSRRFEPRFRIAALVFLPLVYGAQWYGVESLEGWPTRNVMPESFELLSSDIREPDLSREERGAIALWVREKGDRRPRAYLLPYDRKLHEMLHAARQRMQQGIRQVGRVGGREKAGNGAGIGNALELTIEDAPPIVLPPKY